MKNAYEVLQQKETDLARVRHEIESLRIVASLLSQGASFSNFGDLYHYSYPNYLAMIAGSDFGTHKPLLFSDNQRTFNDDNDHRTIADLLNWKNYAEDLPGVSDRSETIPRRPQGKVRTQACTFPEFPRGPE